MTPDRPFRFGFVLSTHGGNRTRYETLRRYAERDPEVECVWAPEPVGAEPGWLRRLPPTPRWWSRCLRRAFPVLRQLSRLDAVMFHTFEAHVCTALRGLAARRPALVWSQDDPPVVSPSFWAEYGRPAPPAWRARAHDVLASWAARRSALLLPFSRWAREALIARCGVPPERVHAVPVGVDLEIWSRARPAPAGGGRPRILFVGSDFARKGGDLLLEVFRRRFAGSADLHLVTGTPPRRPPPGVFVHTGLAPGDPALRALFADADLFALPTRADLSPNAVLEAMATGLPVVATDLCGIPEMVRHGETGLLVPAGDAAALAGALQALLDDPERRRRMGACGRRVVERDFDAATNVSRILDLMKRCARGPARARRRDTAAAAG